MSVTMLWAVKEYNAQPASPKWGHNTGLVFFPTNQDFPNKQIKAQKKRTNKCKEDPRSY